MEAILRSGAHARRPRVSGSQAIALSTVITNLARIISTVCLTRLLTPSVYGIAGMIVSILYAINMLSDVGFQSYLVRHQRTDEPEFLNAVWAIHAGRGAALTLIGVLLSWPLSLLLAKPDLAGPLAAASFIFVIDGQVSLNQFQALRDGRVQRFTFMDLIISVSQVIAGIVFAYFIRNIWAIVASMLFASVVRVLMSYVLFPSERRRFRPDPEIAADLWRFSRAIAASSALTLVITQVDKLALGRILPLSQFGTYVIAATIAAAPAGFAYGYASAIVQPAVAAAVRTGGSIKDAYYQCWKRFFYFYSFCGGGLIGAADLLIRLLYDPRYLPAIHYLRILSISTAFIMLTRSMNDMLIGSGRLRAIVELNLVRLAWLVGGGLIAFSRNDPMLFVLTIGLIEFPAYLYGVWRMNRLGFISWPRELSVPLVASAGLAAGLAASSLGRALFPNL
jgi:lipopolysaccharide exporter